ncbi:BppU family phage baseplate upper protein [Peribacillus butanolivorans]|uniref:BppU family phage baseplate upper protein n=1 Tax=Peribacillus butanolivorans TaxID=421767 RepID=UPI0006A6EC1C|nr:BppU family phage baseplate upper protein [Peribacillus butanolivorans]
MYKLFPITVDTVKKVENDLFTINTNDLNTPKIIITVLQDKEPVTLAEGVIPRLTIKKPDGGLLFLDCVITDALAGQCEVVLTTQAYTVVGNHTAELMVYFASDVVSVTGLFTYSSTKGLLDNVAVESTNEFQSINALVHQASTNVDKAQSFVDQAELIDFVALQNADTKIDSVQAQIDQLVIEGDSSVEAAQMRVDALGNTHVTAKARVDNDYNTVTAQLDGKASQAFLDQKTQGKVNVKEFGAVGNGIVDDTLAIQGALNLAKFSNLYNAIEIEIPAGNYRITSKLYIYRNTKLKLHQKARMIRGGYVSLLVNGEESVDHLLDQNDIHSGHGNITIEGGIWDGNIANQPYANTGYNLFGFARGRNIVIRDAEFRDVVSCHAMDLNALENVLIDNCRFLGYKDGTVVGDSWYPRDYAEAIQISNITSAGWSGIGKFDGSPCKNVTVRNCYFGASGTPGTQAWCVGVGNHGAVHDQYVNNIRVVGCTFDGMTNAGVRSFKFKDLYVLDNIFKACSRSISCSNPDGKGSSSERYDVATNTFIQTGLPQSSKNIIIRGNIFEDSKISDIYIKGWVKESTLAKVEGILIEGNISKRTIAGYTTNGNIDLYLCDGVTIRGYSCNNVRRAVYAERIANLEIDGLRAENAQLEGIYIIDSEDTFKGQGHSTKINIRNSFIKNSPYNGISITNTDVFSFTNNRLENVGTLEDNMRQGFYIGTGAKNGELDRNVVKMGVGNQVKYGAALHAQAENVRVGSNDFEGKTIPAYIPAGTTNWMGHYTFSPDGKRYKVTVSNAGVPTYTVG